jgi:hypothetical protein
MSAAYSELAALPLNQDALAEAVGMTDIERFSHLLHHAKTLVSRYGPYTKHHNARVFMRTRKSPQRPCPPNPSLVDLALSLAAAQDCAYSAQPNGPAKDDLDFFMLLWDSAITVLEEILARGSLPGESFGWGIFGLSAGYMHPPAYDLTAQNIFSRNKYRLHAALCMLPSLDERNENEYTMSAKRTTDVLTRARRDIHTLGHIILHEFRLCRWKRVRWLHAIAVAERWVGAFGLGPQKMVREPVKKTEEMKSQVESMPQKKAKGKHITFRFP